MAIWSELARAGNDAGDEILLRRRDDIYEIRYNGLELMSNVNYQSETVLAERSLRLLERVPQRILIGGLGMGFTLKAALDCLLNKRKSLCVNWFPKSSVGTRPPLGILQASHSAIHVLTSEPAT